MRAESNQRAEVYNGRKARLGDLAFLSACFQHGIVGRAVSDYSFVLVLRMRANAGAVRWRWPCVFRTELAGSRKLRLGLVNGDDAHAQPGARNARADVLRLRLILYAILKLSIDTLVLR